MKDEPKKPQLTIVPQDNDREYAPLPYYAWVERPHALLLDVDECATAIHLSRGQLTQASALLKVGQYRLERMIKRHPALKAVLEEELQGQVTRARDEVIDALSDAENDRRREWAATKILGSRAAVNDPFAPAPPQSTSATSLSLTQGPNGRTITFRWRDSSDDLTSPDPSSNDEPVPRNGK